MQVHVGMSGYAYKEWKGGFYPADLPADGMLAYYATQFPTVEINNTFYRMPAEHVLVDWGSRVPDGFRFALKASRRITHNHRLKDVGDLVDYVVRNASVLGPKLGPMLFQLPPTMKKDVPRLEAFLQRLPAEWRTALEWRHASWADPEVAGVLSQRRVAAVLAEAESEEGPIDPSNRQLAVTAEWGYLRLHRAGYSDADLRAWAAWIRDQSWSECFVYFKHEEDVAGPAVAQRFAEFVA